MSSGDLNAFNVPVKQFWEEWTKESGSVAQCVDGVQVDQCEHSFMASFLGEEITGLKNVFLRCM